MQDIGSILHMNKFESDYHRAALNLMYTGNWMIRASEEALKDYDLSQQQYNVMRILRGAKGKPMSLLAIQQRMLSPMSNATRLVEKLKQKGFVDRTECPSNRRMVEISLTENGEKVLAEIDPLVTARIHATFSGLTAEEARQLSNLLDRLRNGNNF